jgi:hypothetical protein
MKTQVFVVGTGRCGTASMAALLSRVPGGRIVHELTPALHDEARASLRGMLPRHALVELLHRTRDPAVIGGTQVSGEANQRLSFVLPALAEAFPHARIIWLLRDGRDAIASMHARLWYHPREATLRPRGALPWALHRIQGDEVGDLSPATWAGLDRFARCCWYWSYTNRLIAQQRAELPVPVLPLRVERLRESLPELWSFLGLPAPLPTHLPHANASGGRRRGWRSWSRGQRQTFQHLCGAVMDVHYPGWQAEMRWSVGQEVSAALARRVDAARVLVGAHSRPLRARVGWVRRGRQPEGAGS